MPASGNGFASGDYCELREAIEMIGAAAFEMLEGIVIANFRAILEAHQRRIDGGDRADARNAALDRIPGFRTFRPAAQMMPTPVMATLRSAIR